MIVVGTSSQNANYLVKKRVSSLSSCLIMMRNRVVVLTAYSALKTLTKVAHYLSDWVVVLLLLRYYDCLVLCSDALADLQHGLTIECSYPSLGRSTHRSSLIIVCSISLIDLS